MGLFRNNELRVPIGHVPLLSEKAPHNQRPRHPENPQPSTRGEQLKRAVDDILAPSRSGRAINPREEDVGVPKERIRWALLGPCRALLRRASQGSV